VPAEEDRQPVRPHPLRPPSAALELQLPLATLEATVADEVEHVAGLTLAEPLLERRHRRHGQPLHHHLPPLLQLFQRPPKLPPLPLPVQLHRPGGGRDHRQDPQRRLDRQWPDRLGRLGVPHHRRLRRLGQETSGVRVVEQLPGPPAELGDVLQPQPDPQLPPLRPSHRQAGVVTAADVAGEHRLEELGTEAPDRDLSWILTGGLQVPTRPGEAERQVIELVVGERVLEVLLRLARGRAHHPNAVAAAAGAVEEEVEVGVGLLHSESISVDRAFDGTGSRVPGGTSSVQDARRLSVIDNPARIPWLRTARSEKTEQLGRYLHRT